MRRLILGTAGHIDHGKTALVQALTGVDTDRLAEEKRRGITIDLGFAELPVSEDLAFGVVDVPGHESFIRNMLAGATGMDLVLLVVAADEATMPQTREHLAIVRLLGVERVVVALSRIDLVDDEWLELALDDVRELLAGTPHADAPIVPTSAVTGAGLSEVVRAMADAVKKARARDLAAQQSQSSGETVLHRPVPEGFTIQRADDGAFVVAGRAAERTVALSDLSAPGAWDFARERLQRMGVDRALSRAGVKSGDTVRIGALVFEYRDDDEVDYQSDGAAR